MARIIAGSTGLEVYPAVIDQVRRRGRQRDSRNGLTYELEDLTIELDTPLSALPVNTGRKLNKRIAAAEALQLIGCFSDPKWLCRLSPRFKDFTEPGEYFWGAYGQRMYLGGANQLEEVVRKLCADPTTRQAVITLWDPNLDNHTGKRDYPCTVALHFRRRGRTLKSLETLDMKVVMRSNDAWLGLPYDLFQFTQLQLTLCNLLNLEPGTYTHYTWSMHLYFENIEQSYEVTDSVLESFQPLTVSGVGSQEDTMFLDVSERAYRAAHNILENPTESERWYLDVLDGHYAGATYVAPDSN